MRSCRTDRKRVNTIRKGLGKGTLFERIRRITGYLTSDIRTWNNAKQAEERDRVKHSIGQNKPEQKGVDTDVH